MYKLITDFHLDFIITKKREFILFFLHNCYFCRPISTMPDGVTGNTSAFGAEESRFEP